MSIKSEENGKAEIKEERQDLNELNSLKSIMSRIFIQYDTFQSLKSPFCNIQDDNRDQEKIKEILKKELF